MTQEAWGRLVIAGGTDWPNLGRKGNAENKDAEREDLHAPNFVRSVLDIKFKRVFSSHSACHCVMIDTQDRPWFMGRNEHGQLGTDQAVLWEPVVLADTSVYKKVPEALRHAKIINVACGRSHTILVTSDGEAYAAGANNFGACGLPFDGDVWSFTRIADAVAKETIVQAAAGVHTTYLLTKTGKVYAMGSPQNGALGHGRTGESIKNSKTVYQEERSPLLVEGELRNKNIVQIASGQMHCLALSDEGYLFSWGYGANGRLGHDEQKDCLLPRIVNAFTRPNRILRVSHIACGNTNSLAIDGQGMLYLWGKFKNTGDGSVGQPWMYPKAVPEITSCKFSHISAGGVTLFAIRKDEPMLVGMGQNANCGELGLGVGQVKSATKFQEIASLTNLEVLDIAAGQNTTFMIIRPPFAGGQSAPPKEKSEENPPPSNTFDSGWGFAASPAPPAQSTSEDTQEVAKSFSSRDAWDQLGRFPTLTDASENCEVCEKDSNTEDNPLLECLKCEKGYHLRCVSPAIDKIPDDDFYCAACENSHDLSAVKEETVKAKPKSKAKKPTPKRKRQNQEEDDGSDEAAEEVLPQKKRR